MLNVKKVNYNEDFTPGCETCDWGSSYINEIEITLEDGTYTNIKIDKMYEYALSESDCMKLVVDTNNINDFCISLIEHINKTIWTNKIDFLISLCGLTITINGEQIDILKTLEYKKIIFDEEGKEQ